MTSTARNFAGQNLRGRSFKGQDLSGANFSGADLRGVDFTDAILIGANFSDAKTKTGVQKRWLVFQLIISFFMSALSGFLAAFTGSWAIVFFNPDNIKSFSIAPSIVMTMIIISLYFAIIRQGFSSEAFRTLTIAVAVAALVALASVVVAAGGKVSGAVTVSMLGTMAVTGTVSVSLILALAVSALVAMSGALAVLVAMVGVLVGAMAGAVSNIEELSRLVAVSGAGAIVLLSIYVAWRTLKGDPKFDILLKFAVAFTSIGGTSFRGADLRNADFTEATLKSSDLRNSRQQHTNLNQALWKQSQKLDRARVGQTILANPEVRELLVKGKPNQSKSYEGFDLRGANLDGVYLEKVNFKRAILSEASFRNANLELVNLTETQAIGTDFTGARMTGVCLEGWSYDHTTKLDDVDCRFVFELEHPNAKGSLERRPHDPEKEFAEGDFTKLYNETLNVVKLLIRNGINPEAFNDGWQKAIKDNPKISFENIQEIKKKGQDVVVIVIVPEGTDKGKFEQNFDSGYETNPKVINAKHQAVIEAKDAEINSLRKDKSYFQDLLFLQFTQSTNINFNPTLHNEAKAVTEQNPVTIKAGRDISGNVINLGKIKGNVTNAINQIPNKEDSGDIKTLLTQLQEAISADKDLADEDKADALEQVENLAKIALHDKPEEKSTLASKAIRALKRIIDNIPTISKIVETVGKALGLA